MMEPVLTAEEMQNIVRGMIVKKREEVVSRKRVSQETRGSYEQGSYITARDELVAMEEIGVAIGIAEDGDAPRDKRAAIRNLNDAMNGRLLFTDAAVHWVPVRVEFNEHPDPVRPHTA